MTTRTCTDCGTRFEIQSLSLHGKPPEDRDTCRRCAGLVCPGCGGPTADRAYCARDSCQAIAADEDEALREDVVRERGVARLVRRAG